MGNKLYVGNLAYSVRDNDLQQAFGQFGTVTSAKVMMERDTGRSKGFGFVEMGNDAEAQAAIAGMNGQALSGRSIVVNEARPMEPRAPRAGGGSYAGGGGGGGYGAGPDGVSQPAQGRRPDAGGQFHDPVGSAAAGGGDAPNRGGPVRGPGDRPDRLVRGAVARIAVVLEPVARPRASGCQGHR